MHSKSLSSVETEQLRRRQTLDTAPSFLFLYILIVAPVGITGSYNFFE